MANYNSKRTYNRVISDSGAYYNSGPYTINVFDSGSGQDIIGELQSLLSVNDVALGNDIIILVAEIDVADQSSLTSDIITFTGLPNISDTGSGIDNLLPIEVSVPISEIGNSSDVIGIAGAFFVIDSNNILQPLGVIVSRDSRYELLPATRDRTEEIPGRHGEIDFGSELKSRLLELHVNTNQGFLPLEKSQLQRLFAKYLDPTKGAKTLIFSDDIEKTYKVKYSGQIDLTQYASWFQFVIPLKMTDPLISGSFEKMMVGTGILVNDGTFETSLIIEISGPITNPSVTIGTDTLTYTGTIPSGQKLIIDTGLETAILNGVNALGQVAGPLPLFIQPGDINVVAGNSVTIRWRDKWI